MRMGVSKYRTKEKIMSDAKQIGGGFITSLIYLRTREETEVKRVFVLNGEKPWFSYPETDLITSVESFTSACFDCIRDTNVSSQEISIGESSGPKVGIAIFKSVVSHFKLMRINYSPVDPSTDSFDLASLLGCTITRRSASTVTVSSPLKNDGSLALEATIGVPNTKKDHDENELVPKAE